MYERRGVLTTVWGVGAALLFGVLVAGCGLLERLETQDGDPGFGPFSGCRKQNWRVSATPTNS